MTLSSRVAAYADCVKFFEEALADEIGARTKFKDRADAHYFSMRMHQTRTLLRAETKSIYDESDPRYGKCEFDRLVIRIRYAEDTYWVHAERPNAKLKSEPLSTLPAEDA